MTSINSEIFSWCTYSEVLIHFSLIISRTWDLRKKCVTHKIWMSLWRDYSLLSYHVILCSNQIFMAHWEENLLKSVVNTGTSSDVSTNDTRRSLLNTVHSGRPQYESLPPQILESCRTQAKFQHFVNSFSKNRKSIMRGPYEAFIQLWNWEIISVITNNCDICKQTLNERCQTVFFQMETGEAANIHHGSWSLSKCSRRRVSKLGQARWRRMA
jgi:hypothetical protein